MVTEATNTVFDCAACGEPKYRDPRHGDWLHIRRDSLCNDDGEPVARRLPLPSHH